MRQVSPVSWTAVSTNSSRRGREMLCGTPISRAARRRDCQPEGPHQGQPGERPRFGGIVYTGSAEKVAYFIETASRERLPILFIQDVSGFMVGPEAEQSGIIRAGARFVEAMATAVVPKIVLTVNHASGAGYYAMAGQGFDPDFILSWPTGRMGVMEGESAVMAVHGGEIEKARSGTFSPTFQEDLPGYGRGSGELVRGAPNGRGPGSGSQVDPRLRSRPTRDGARRVDTREYEERERAREDAGPMGSVMSMFMWGLLAVGFALLLF